jgi:hypothetical protein
VRLRIREEVDKGKCLRPVPLRSAGYIGLLCQLSFSPSTSSTTRRSVAPFLPKPTGFVIEKPMPTAFSPLRSPEPPVILEEYVELHGESPTRYKSKGLSLPWKESSPLPTHVPAVGAEWLKKMAIVMQELEEQKRLMERQQEELGLASQNVAQLARENSELTKSVQQLSESLHQSEGEQKKWQVKFGEIESVTNQLTREKEDWERSKSDFTKERAEWLNLKGRQERAIATKSAKVKSLETQVRAFLTDEKEVMDLQQRVKGLKSLSDAQVEMIQSFKARVDRLKSGLWAIESACPPFHSLFKSYELQRDIFFIAYDLKPSQVLEPIVFERLWEEVVRENHENLLTEILVRGELKLRDSFKGFQIIVDLGVHVFLYYS